MLQGEIFIQKKKSFHAITSNNDIKHGKREVLNYKEAEEGAIK